MYGVLSVQSIISLPGSIYSSQDKQIACKVKPKQTKKQKTKTKKRANVAGNKCPQTQRCNTETAELVERCIIKPTMVSFSLIT